MIYLDRPIVMESNNRHNIPLHLIARHLSGEATDEENHSLEQWIRENDTNRKIFGQYKDLWERSRNINKLEKIDIGREWARFSQSAGIDKPVRKINSLKLLTRLAAAIIAGLIVGYSGLLIYRNSQYEKVTAVDKAREVSLPDGSLVTLNAGSVIKYPKSFKGNTRIVKLDGEGFFDVVSNPIKPFSVEATEIIVKVLGTSFNIDVFGNKNIVTVIVDEGKVAIYDKSGADLSGVLLKGDKAVINSQTGTITKSKNDDPNFNSYKTGYIVFENTPLDQVANTLSKAYNVNINIERQEVYHSRITVTFTNKDLDYVLRTIEETLDLEIEKNNREIIIK